ncbi:putative ribosomal RNA-processing protein 7 homolog B [Corticium candelabrum]|uniref:putative ribosomal RNA-processing protein 7 homolog B n=1 Tax=Corticium candelabrum TaxID=121492 RepID=UPI002E336F65|nr:putative ribosomal RNA-processing protein 7 homolog B [Corticium candelabrum]
MRKRPGLVSTESTDCLSSQSRSLKESPGLRNALGMDPSVERYLSTPSCQIATGMKKWIHEYRSKWPDPSSLQVEIDDYMIKFDEKSKQEREEQQAKQGQPDDEGWVTITRTKKAFKPNETNRREMLRTKKKRKQKELLNFYQFQQRETKRDQIAQLRKKFEEDKHKIATMRATRKFRPYN